MNFLPPEHQPGGFRSTHDDYPWPFKWVPRSWTSFMLLRPPVMILGNQQFFCNFFTHETKADRGIMVGSHAWGPKPVPRPGEWQFTVVFVIIRGREIPLPYFAFTTKSRWHFRVGARWTDPQGDGFQYITFPSIAIKRL